MSCQRRRFAPDSWLWLVALVAVGIASSSGCRQRPAADLALSKPLVRGVLSLASEASSQLSLALAPSQVTSRRLASMVTVAKGTLERALEQSEPAELVTALNRLIFGELKFRRQLRDEHLASALLPYVLEQHQGNCLGLAALYLTLGEQLGLPLKGVLVPGHFFVRYEGRQDSINIELLRQGERMTHSWYRRKYRVPRDNPLYLRSLSAAESLAVFRYNLANALRARAKYRQALTHYRHVVHILPLFAEAHANHGLTLHLLGHHDRAKRAYLDAKEANPQLDGLQHNLDALESKTPDADPVDREKPEG